MKRTFCDFCDQEIIQRHGSRVIAHWPLDAPMPPTSELERKDACEECWRTITQYLARLGPR